MGPERQSGGGGLAALAVLAPLLWSGCVERTPTSLDEDLLPEAPVTVEVFVPWAEFGSRLEVFGGFGSARELGQGVVANQFEGTLEARTLARHGSYPESTSVRDSTGTVVTDDSLTFVGGRVVARFDTLAVDAAGPVLFSLAGTQVEWDPTSVTWTNAVDSIGDSRPWPTPGGGPVTELDTATWDPTAGDSVVFDLDSTTVASLADTSNHARGFRLESLTPDVRLQLRTVDLQLVTRPSVHPDTLVNVNVPRTALTFIYDPIPAPPPDGIRVGGVPAWRTYLAVAVPDTLTGPPSLCEAVGCPVAVGPDELNYASLLLTTRASPPAYQPSDSVFLDLRPVLARDACPKCPLGEVTAPTRRLGPSVFADPTGTVVELPITTFARDRLRGETAAGAPPPTSLALLSTFEPVSIAFASFQGPGTAQEPVLRMLLTVGGEVRLR